MVCLAIRLLWALFEGSHLDTYQLLKPLQNRLPTSSSVSCQLIRSNTKPDLDQIIIHLGLTFGIGQLQLVSRGSDD